MSTAPILTVRCRWWLRFNVWRAAQAARPLASLSRQGRENADAVSDFVTTHGSGARNLGYIPVRARNRDFAMVVDRKSGEIVGYIAVNPW